MPRQHVIYEQRMKPWACIEVRCAARENCIIHIERSQQSTDAYFSEPSGMAALIFEAEADEHPPPPVPARVALLGSMFSTEATALSICEGILEKDLMARFAMESNMRGTETTCDF